MRTWTYDYQQDREQMAQLNREIAEMHRVGDIFFGGPGAYSAFLKRHHTLTTMDEINESWKRIYAFWDYHREQKS